MCDFNALHKKVHFKGEICVNLSPSPKCTFKMGNTCMCDFIALSMRSIFRGQYVQLYCPPIKA